MLQKKSWTHLCDSDWFIFSDRRIQLLNPNRRRPFPGNNGIRPYDGSNGRRPYDGIIITEKESPIIIHESAPIAPRYIQDYLVIWGRVCVLPTT